MGQFHRADRGRILGLGLAKCRSPDDKAELLKEVSAALAEKWIYHCEYRVRFRDGSFRHTVARGAPVCDETGTIVEWVGTNTDVEAQYAVRTALSASEARSRFLDSMGEATRTLERPDEILMKVTEQLGQYLNVSRCAYADVEADSDHFTIPYDWTNGVQSTVGSYRLDLFGPLAVEKMRQGQTLIIGDVDNELTTETGGAMFNAIGVKAIVCCPLVKAGRLVAMMAVHQTTPRQWTEAEVRLVEDVVERSWSYIERTRTGRELRQSEERFRLVTDTMPQLVWSTLPDGFHDFYNRRWYEYTGLTYGDTQGEGWNDVLHPDDQARSWEVWRHSLETGDDYEIEYRFRRYDGVYRWFIGRALPLRNANGEIVRWFGTCTDIDDQKQAEQESRLHQAEIEALNARLQRSMQETHHRIKNNLQVIAALVEIEEEASSDGDRLSRNRINQHIRALATIHDLLTQQAKGDSDLNHISAKTMLERLVPMLQSTSGDRNIRAAVGDVSLTVQQSTSLALLVNEAVSNAIKHGRGDIEISLTTKDSVVRLAICDEGAGFPPGFNAKRAAKHRS